MTPKISLVVIPVLAGLALAPAAWGSQPNLRAVLAADSVESAREQVVASRPFNHRDVLASDSVESAREQVAASRPFNLRDVLASDSVETAVAASEQSRRTSALAYAGSAGERLVGDNYREAPKPVSRPTTIAASGSGGEIEWLQIGLGFGLGTVLALSLFLAMRHTRIRPLAH